MNGLGDAARRRWLRSTFLVALPGAALAFACSSFTTADAPVSADAAPLPPPPGDAMAADAPAIEDGGIFATYAKTVLADSPLAYWRMSTAALDLVPDESGNKHDLEIRGTGHGFAATGATADGDHAISFNGDASFASSDLKDASPFGGTHAFTIEGWAAQSADAGLATFASADMLDGGPDGVYVYSLPEPKYAFGRSANGNVTANGSAALDLGLYHHLVLTYDGTNLVFYVDGEPSTAMPSSSTFAVTSTTVFTVGRDAAYARNWFPGRLDEVAVYDHALTGESVRRHFRAAALDGGA